MQKDEGCDSGNRRSIRKMYFVARLPVDPPADGRSRVDFCGHHVGGECGPQSRAASFDRFGCACRLGVNRFEYFCVLRVCRPTRTGPRADRDVGNDKTLVLSTGVYRCPNRMERLEGSVGIRFAAHCLTAARTHKWLDV